jgi:oxygen-dependent protoporphyrinogen oxidase
MIRSLQRDGFTLETGPNVIVERPDLSQLVSELGLQSALRYPAIPKYGQWVWARNQPMKVPGGLGELLRSPLFSLKTKIALPFALFSPGLLTPRADDLSVLEFFEPLIGRRTAIEMLDPVLKGIYGGDVERLSARTIFPGLWEAAVRRQSLVGYMKSKPKGNGKPSVVVLQGGIEVLVSTLVQRLREAGVEFRSCAAQEVASVGALTSGDAGRYSIKCSDGSVLETSRCVVTVAGEPLSALLESLDGPLASSVRSMQYASLTVFHGAVARSERLIPDAFGILFPAGMPDNLLGVMFNSLIFPHVAPPDKHLVTVIVGGAQSDRQRVDSADISARLPELLSATLGIQGFSLLETTEWRHAIPQLAVGHHRLVQVCDDFESRYPGLFLAGVERGGVGVSDRIKMARAVVAKGWS